MEAHRSPIATEAVERIGALYAIEKEIRGRPPDERRGVRNTRSRPLLDAMHAWLETSLSKLSRKSDTSAAIHYALARWDAFARYCDDGRIEIDNSAAERALRAVAVGRKNYLFAGSDAGGERAASPAWPAFVSELQLQHTRLLTNGRQLFRDRECYKCLMA
jgi:hypothetical protein